MSIPGFLRTLALCGAISTVGIGLWLDLTDARWMLFLGAAWLLVLFALHVDIPRILDTFNRSLVRVAGVIVSLFAVMAVQLARTQVIRSDQIYNRIGEDPDGEIIANARANASGLQVKRGRIFDRNGALLADTLEQDGNYIREYPEPDIAYVCGYFSPLLYGLSGLELTWNDELTGRDRAADPETWLDGLLNRPRAGYDLHLTIDTELQKLATQQLQDFTGAVVLIEVATGEVLALASSPSIDPERLFTTSSAENEAAASYWDQMLEDPEKPLVVRATDGLYTPGSTFKTITAAIAIEADKAETDSVFEDNGSITIDGRELIENNRPDDSQNFWTLEEGVGWSLNVVLAQVGLLIGADLMWDATRKFGFGEPVPFDVLTQQSQIANDRDFLDSQNGLADTAFGQGEILVSPLHMAVITAGFANGGRMMRPRLVASVRDGADIERTTESTVWKQPISEEAADDVQQMMVFAVEEGAIRRASGTGYRLGGKTGTAEIPDGVNTWFIGFVGDPEPEYAVAVVLEDSTAAAGTTVDIGTWMLVSAMEQNS